MKATMCFAIISAMAFASAARPANADTVEITFASGRVQTVELEEKAKEVKDIKLKEVNALPLPEKVLEFIGVKPVQQPAPKEQPPAAKKTGPSLKWAPPVSE